MANHMPLSVKQKSAVSPDVVEKQRQEIEEQRRIIRQLRAALELSRAALLQQRAKSALPSLPALLSRYAVGLRATKVTIAGQNEWWEEKQEQTSRTEATKADDNFKKNGPGAD
jgi:hypothetical protein